MPGLNISRSEARERSSHLSVSSYKVSIDFCQGPENFLVKSVVNFTCNYPGYETFIDAVGKRIISATLNGASVDTSSYDGESLVIKGLAAENELIIEIEGIYSKTGEGLQYSVDPADNEVYLYSQGETAYIRKMYPCFDQPDLKATFQLTVTAPTYWEVISNSPVKSKNDLGENKSVWEFLPTPRISTYITALIAGPYYHVHDEYNGEKKVPLGIYCRKSLADSLDPENIFEVTKQGFAYFEKVFGLAYPFEKYDQIAVVDFNWGAMENSGAVTFLENLLVFRSKVTERMYEQRANTILHEMAHMWFGNMVTMQWWDDLWLNESFAEWSSHLACAEGTRFKDAWIGFNSGRKNWAYRQDQLSSTHPIATDMTDIETVNANFDGITYAKGASVLQQLVAHVGRDNFINGLKKYFAKHAFKNTTLNDLLVELEATSGRDLKPWVSTWLETAGVNTLRPKLTIAEDKYSKIEITQEAPLVPAGSTELRPHRLAVGIYDVVGKEVLLRKSVELDVEGAITSVPDLAGEKVGDLLLINDRDFSYAKVRLDDRSVETLKNNLGNVKDNLTRAMCWAISWDMLRDAELSASDFIDIAIAGLPGETNITVVTTIEAQLVTAIELYSNPEKRDALREKLASAIEKLLDAAPAGSDHQLQFARAFTSLAATPSQGARIKELLDGKLAGLKIDADLRWTFVNGLVERGIFNKAELDTELARDNTINGQMGYAQGVAAIRSAEAKATAWHSITKEDMTSSIRESTLRGFLRASQRDLLNPYVDKYFELLLDMWGKKSYDISSSYVDMCFPIFSTNQATLDKANNWLSSHKDAASGLIRLVSENRDALTRALKAQAKDN
jgi:aminopeptidase N